MKLLEKNITQELNEEFLIESLNLNNKTILELGCGDAQKSIKLATNGFDRKVIACEVDEVQYKKNLEKDIANIEFLLCGAQDIPLKDESVEIIFLFKSFHHIPEELMDKALTEMKRVLKPNGLIYISEPLFQGPLNDIISVFHDEEYVREKAFEAIKRSVEKEQFKLFNEIFFYTPVTYKDFEDFKSKVMNVTFNDYSLDEETIEKTKEKFENYTKKTTTFEKPFRVDILQKI